MAQVITVSHGIWADEGITEAWPETGPTARVVFTCAWDDRYALVNQLKFQSVRSGNTVIRTMPFAYPPSPNLFCKTIESIVPYGRPHLMTALGLPWLARNAAKVTANFGILPFTDPTTFSTLTINVSGEFLTVPDTVYKFGDGTPTGAPVGLLIPQIELNMKRHWLPFLPVQQMASVVGRVNGGPYTIGGLTADPGTLLFGGGTSEVQADTGGSLTYNTEMKFIYRYIPWNNYMRPDGSGFYPVSDAGGNPPYQDGDFSVLP